MPSSTINTPVISSSTNADASFSLKSLISFEWLKRLTDWKRSLQLPNPGSFENLHREARNVALTNLLFEGGKADLAKGLSQFFQVSHSYTLGSTQIPPTYHFASIFVQGKHLLHGMVDTNGIVQGKYQYAPTEHTLVKLQGQLSKEPGQSMVQVEGDVTGADWTLNAKAINPEVLLDQGTGIYALNFMQSIHSKVAIGVETVCQRVSSLGNPFMSNPKQVAAKRSSPQVMQELITSVAAKISTPGGGLLTLQTQQLGAFQASYWHRISERLELATEWQAVLVSGPRQDSLCTVGAKFDYKQACIRAQVDSQAKVGLVYEEKLFPGFSLMLSGELDHLHGTSRWGFGVSLEN